MVSDYYIISIKKQSKNKVSTANTEDLFMEQIFGNQLVCYILTFIQLSVYIPFEALRA